MKPCHGGTPWEREEKIGVKGQAVKTSRGRCTAVGWRSSRPKRRFSCSTAGVLPEVRAGVCPAEGRPPGF